MSGTKTEMDILDDAYERASSHLSSAFVDDPDIQRRLHNVINSEVGAGVRALLAACLAKAYDPLIDITKPYTNIEGHSYSGRDYDQKFISEFRNKYDLPLIPTTGFLTPALRTKNIPLVPGTQLHGADSQMYQSLILLLDDVAQERVSPEDILYEVTRQLLLIKKERHERLDSLLNELKRSSGELPLSVEDVVNLIQQHLSLPKSSRLPVLVIASAYEVASEYLGKRPLPRYAHNAADKQTGALGDLEITLVSGEDTGRIVTTYEMKMKRVTREDIDIALQKVVRSGIHLDNYLFITTDTIDPDVADYAKSKYQESGGTEFAVLDCIAFIRHFLHLFHHLRTEFLDTYQNSLLEEPESAVRHSLKQAFLALRTAAESGYAEGDY